MKRLFMPGCALSAYSPFLTAKVGEYLKACFADLAIAQKCCARPTKLIGQSDLFCKRIGLLEADIRKCRAKQIIVACPGCLDTLKDIKGVQVISLWEILCEIGLPTASLGKAKNSNAAFSIHDSCVTRENHKMHQCVRELIKKLGYTVVQSANEGINTLCCGQGGMVNVANSALSSAAASKCMDGFKTKHIAVYCASCRGTFLANGGKAWHMLDLIWGDVVMAGNEPPPNILTSPIKAWKNRLTAKILINGFIPKSIAKKKNIRLE